MLVLLILLILKNNFALELEYHGKTVRMDKFFDPCEDQKGAVGNFSAKNIKSVGKILQFDISLYTAEVIKKGDIELFFERCNSKEALDTCKIFQKFKTGNGCTLLTAKNQVWTSLFNCLKPNIKCPIQPGYYNGTSCSLDISLFNLFPVGRYYWNVKSSLTLNSRQVFCLMFSGDFTKI